MPSAFSVLDKQGVWCYNEKKSKIATGVIAMCDIFISYSSKDQTIADAVLCAMESRGIRCWIAYRDADVGDEYAASIVRAIRACQVVILIYSQNSNASKQVLNEVNSATNAGKTIVPFKIDNFQPGDSFEYYLGKTHWLDAITPPMQDHIDRLCDTARAIMDGTAAPKRPTPIAAPITSVPVAGGGCRIATYEDLIKRGYTAATIAMQLVENDYIVCNGIGDANEGSAAQWEEILRDHNDSVIYLLNEEGRIVGDFNIIALPEELMEKAKKGEFLECDLSYDEVEFTGFPGEYHGYILALGTLPDYRNTKNTMMLLNEWVRCLEEQSEAGVFYKDICINVFNRETEAVVKGMGFKYLCDNVEFGKIYALDFLPLPNIKFFRQHKKLVENYENYYNENL